MSALLSGYAPYEIRTTRATRVFDARDRFAFGRGVRGPHPRPIGPLRYRILGEMVGGARQLFDVPLRLVIVRNASGYDLWFGMVESDGEPVPAGFAAGTYVLRVDSKYHQHLEREDLVLPEHAIPYSFDVSPGFAYPYPAETAVPGGVTTTLLRGTLLESDGTGIPGVTIEVVGEPPTYLTGTAGQWALPFDDTVAATANATVRVTRPGNPPDDIVAVTITPGQETTLRQASLRGTVRRASGLGMEGVAVTVSGQPNSTTTDTEGNWNFYFPLTSFPLGPPPPLVDVTATPATGAPQTQQNIQPLSRAAVVVPEFVFP